MSDLARFARFFGEILGLRLEPFQAEIVKEVFSPRRETVILIPRGGGKSTLLGAIGLWHLLSTPHPQAVVGAASREQATVLFDIVRDLVGHPSIAKRVEVTRREIRTANGWLRVVASDGPKQHGLILSLAIVDELPCSAAGEGAGLGVAAVTGMIPRRGTADAHLERGLPARCGYLRRRARQLALSQEGHRASSTRRPLRSSPSCF